MTRNEDSNFVHDGHERVHTASFDKIRIQVEAEYAEQLQSASWARRLLLKAEMSREIERRLDRIAPPDVLYISASR